MVPMRIRYLLAAVLILPFVQKPVFAQTVYLPHGYATQQKLSPLLYHTDSNRHTSFNSAFVDPALGNQLYTLPQPSARTTWAGRKLLDEHLIEVNQGKFSLYADVLPELQIGRSTRESTQTWAHSWGVQLGAHVDNKLHVYGNVIYNQSKYPGYVGRYIAQHEVIPGQGHVVNSLSPIHQYDWPEFTAAVAYTPNRYLNVSLGYDKNFIGDGYRSLLLSDLSANYFSFKLSGKIGNVQYTSMWAHMRDPFASKTPITYPDGTATDIYNTHKYGAFQYLDWNASTRLSVGFFQSVLWSPNNASGRRGFDMNYLNPIIFMRAVELTNTSSPDKMHLGLNSRYKISNQLTAYGQFLLSEFTAKEFFAGNGYVHNKFAVQLGLRGHNLFDLNRLNFLAEFNTARPHTYQHFTAITNYTHDSQPLAHPLGANFREGIFLLNYGIKRVELQAQTNWALYGKDPDAGVNYGGNIFKDYTFPARYYGNKIGQGLTTHQTFTRLTAAYLINPKSNLRVEASTTFRNEWNDQQRDRTLWLNIGITSSFRNRYWDL